MLRQPRQRLNFVNIRANNRSLPGTCIWPPIATRARRTFDAQCDELLPGDAQLEL